MFIGGLCQLNKYRRFDNCWDVQTFLKATLFKIYNYYSNTYYRHNLLGYIWIECDWTIMQPVDGNIVDLRRLIAYKFKQ